MTPEAFSVFSVCLEYLPHGTAPAWDDGCARFYFAVLSDIPDDATGVLMKAVGSEFRFRPTPHEVLDVWRKISRHHDALTPAALVASLADRVRKHGAYGQPHPTIKNFFCAGPPPDLTDAEAAVVATWGGWGAFCEDDSPVGVRRGQMLKIAEMVLAGGNDDEIRRLRLEYREQQAALPSPQDYGDGDNGGEMFDPFEDVPPRESHANGTDNGLVRVGATGLKGIK